MGKAGQFCLNLIEPLVTFFHIALTRCTEAAKNLLGENFEGILTSDRHGAYNWVDIERRQLCWAHLRREFIKISERSGVSKELGTALVKQQEKLFDLWHLVRDGTLARCDFVELVTVRSLILEGREELMPDRTRKQYDCGSTKTGTRVILGKICTNFSM